MPELAETRRARNAFFNVFPDFTKTQLRKFRTKLRAGKVSGDVFNNLVEAAGARASCFYGTLGDIVAPRIEGCALLNKASNCDAADEVETYMFNIHEGDTPKNSRPAKNVDNWVSRYLGE